ncbi:ATP phosphoribosyltransferase [Pseudoblastomonas halimionae]|uniref:ATP phosphoribosyltransferase n=1 Tax=Alteriqipengyuania halimionae TaxID=1926630 RepID=A0A6I4U4B0_9SPHN|nr:ATP phosphoribosyltransferase [Alteriqipengyuania halimionae]MXP10556.1 ATP phosphoribosyltransferase [Alteriqipengyuania halimionae]
MFADRDRLHIALQKSGRLSDRSRDLLSRAGLRIQDGKNRLTARVENFPIDLMFVRDDDIPTLVNDGVCEFGVVGENVLREFELGRETMRIETVAKLGFGSCTLKIAAPIGFDYAGAQSLAGQRIATSYPRITTQWLADQGVEAEVVEMNGAVELAPKLGIAGFICDLVSTGQTLEANNLAAVDLVMESEAVLVRAKREFPAEMEELSENILTRIDGVLASAGSKYILLNAPGEALGEIQRILPGAGSPTVTPLHGKPGQFAVHAVCQESVFWETLQELKAAGGSAILVMPIEKMMA